MAAIAESEAAPGEPTKAAVTVANALRRAIVKGQLPVGSWLPAENRLVEEFDVSRPTLRAGLRILESEQLVLIRRGSRGGAMVTPPTDEVLSRRAGTYLQYHQVSLDEVHRARVVIEPPAVAILARRCDPDDIAVLRQFLDREIEVVQDRAAFRAAALNFHRAVIKLCGSPTLAACGAILHGVIEQHADRYAVNQAKYRHGAERHKEHIDVIDLISRGEAEAAEALWREHLEAARQVLMKEGGANTLVDLMS
jgi:DNA-binding FadR family transcriptional regulator